MSGSEYVGVDAARTRRIARWHPLAPVAHRNRWIGVGLLVQAVGVGVLAAYAFGKYKHDQALGLAAKATVMLVWEQTVHSHSGLAVCAAAAVVFAVGCVLAARPFARTVEMLVGVVPLAAIVGVLILGALVFVVAILWIVAMAGDIGTGGGGGGGGSRSKAPRPSRHAPDLRDTPLDPNA